MSEKRTDELYRVLQRKAIQMIFVEKLHTNR